MSRKRANSTENTGVELDDTKYQHQPKRTNSLTVKLDHLKTFDALTDNQQKFFDIYKKGGYFGGLWGSPGVGKSFLVMYRAIEEVLNRDNPFKQLVVVRSTVQVRDQGHLPGTLEEKQSVFELPYKEICTTLFGRPDAWDRLKEQGHARFISTTAIRGISIDDSVILVDEAQNCTWAELASIMGRVGHRSKIFFCGDRFQNDLIYKKNDVSGLSQFLDVVRTMKEYEEVVFTSEDIVRSSLVKSFIIACEKHGVVPSN